MQLFASLREGSDGHNQAGAAVKLISIHAPVKGATVLPMTALVTPVFQSTLPRRERRSRGHNQAISRAISIHAPARFAHAPMSAGDAPA